ncbi:hypothetical protein A8C56_16340 [Niabella ginsenosidivorans]|uniref:DUF4293 domain-containing protein n=1 Tax=Niabella ginsenosidivorans TaxID=1176587 RepID=A0A1A9I6J2_9BACT|nr:DUF4293 domain-containing protein [Niabella ginsenosidivorans]ANH82320.1 hypothetical protein A8C56_16340 [Niabella ginsenosidivorans]
MIQRKQTLWLLLSLICAVLTFKLPFYNGTVINGTEGVTGAEITATDNIWLLLLTSAIALLSIVDIFLYKNRKLQLRLAFIGLLAAVGLIALYVSYIKNFQPGGRISLTALLTFGILVGFFFALKGIRRDQKLVRDLNRLR